MNALPWQPPTVTPLPRLLCPHCDQPPGLVDDTDHWACPCGGHGHTSQLVPEGQP